VAYEVAKALRAPLDVFMVRKLGLPGHKELAMGAIASGGTCVLNDDVVRAFKIPIRLIAQVASQERRELLRRERAYRGKAPMPSIKGRVVILVDDGLATGSTMQAAVTALRQFGPARIVVAVPTAAAPAREELLRKVDDCVCVVSPDPFYAVGLSYADFPQVTDHEVHEILDRSTRDATVPPA